MFLQYSLKNVHGWAEMSSSPCHTTNACESFHAKFNKQFYTPHPNIFVFIQVLNDTTYSLTQINQQHVELCSSFPWPDCPIRLLLEIEFAQPTFQVSIFSGSFFFFITSVKAENGDIFSTLRPLKDCTGLRASETACSLSAIWLPGEEYSDGFSLAYGRIFYWGSLPLAKCPVLRRWISLPHAKN